MVVWFEIDIMPANFLNKHLDVKVLQYLDIISAIVVVINTRGQVAYINKLGAKAMGYTPQEMIGQDWVVNFLPKDIQAEVKQLSQKMLKGKIKVVEHFENPIVTKTGQQRIIAWSGQILKDDQGKITGHMSTGIDITDLKESQHLFQTIVEHSHDAIMVTQMNGVVSYLSPSAKRVLGHDPKRIVGIDPDIIDPQDKDKVAQAFQSALQGQSGSQLEYRIVTDQGQSKWISHSWSPIISQGKIKEIVSIISDIDETKRRTEQEAQRKDQLIDALRKYEIMFNINRDIIIQLDPKGKILDINNRVEDYGYAKSDFIGKSTFKLAGVIPKKWWPKIVQVYAQRMKKAEVENYEIQIKDKQGSLYDVEISPVSIRNDQGKVIGAFVSLHDITQLKKSQQELKDKIKDLERLNELMVGRELKMAELKKKLKQYE